jgi:hypothetical protein
LDLEIILVEEDEKVKKARLRRVLAVSWTIASHSKSFEDKIQDP